jgi:hypothetical protein
LKKITSIFLVSICFTILITAVAEANRRDNRQQNQRQRIREGVKSGELNRREARHLRAQQGRVRRVERRAEADGVVTNKEKAHIENIQNRASKNIYQQKHDGQKAGQNSTTPPSPENPDNESN